MSDESLRAAAEDATPGPWEAPEGDGGWSVMRGNFEIVVEASVSSWDAAYIAAASPDVVLDLLDRLARAEGAVARVRALAGRLNDPAMVARRYPAHLASASALIAAELRAALDVGEVTG